MSKIIFINGKSECGCKMEFSDGHGEYSDVHEIILCNKHKSYSDFTPPPEIQILVDKMVNKEKTKKELWIEEKNAELKSPNLKNIFWPNPPKFNITGGIGQSVKVIDKNLGDWSFLRDGLREHYIGKIGRIVEVEPVCLKYMDEDELLNMAWRQNDHGVNGHSYKVRFPTSYDTFHNGPVEITFVEEHLEAV
jgi:hypothetical protein